jgi:hypothetical protein
MRHLEARFDFVRLKKQLAVEGVNLMKPSSDFDFLRQAFTEGRAGGSGRRGLPPCLRPG